MSKTYDTAVRPLYAVAGATDLAVELARGYVADAQDRATATQKRISSVDLEPKALQARVTDLAKQRQARVEKRVNELQGQAKAFPGKVESYAKETVSDLSETYSELVSRGEDVVARIRNQESTKEAVAAVRTTESQAKATRTTAQKGAKSTTSRAKATRTTAKKSATATKSRAKATGTSARKAAEKTVKAVEDGAKKVG